MTYPNEIIFDATALLETVCPEKILIVGESIFGITDQYHEQCQLIQKKCDINKIPISTTIDNNAFNQRYDLAIVSETIESVSKQSSEQLIGRLRDLCSPRIILIAELSGSLWQENELLGFGLNKQAEYNISEKTFIIYQYNIDSYKKTPDWFNPKHWANPQLWNKFWW